MWRKRRGVRLRPTFLFAVFLALTLRDGAREELLLLFVSAALHECAHAVLLRRFGCRDLTLTLLPGGLRLADDAFAALPYRRLAAAALAGPLCNFLMAGVCALLRPFFRLPLPGTAAALNLKLGLWNLLPLSFLDGGAALYALASQRKQTAPPDPRPGDLLCSAVLCLLCGAALWLRIKAEFLLAFTGYCLVYQLLQPARVTGSNRR